jgi:hypothetical protein
MSSEGKAAKTTIAAATKGVQNLSPVMLNGKASAVAPKLSGDDHVEMEDIMAAGPESQDQDIMQLARIGDVPAMEKLFDSGKYDALHEDAEGITPLHVWF